MKKIKGILLNNFSKVKDFGGYCLRLRHHEEIYFEMKFSQRNGRCNSLVEVVYESFPSGFRFREDIVVDRIFGDISRTLAEFPDVEEKLNERRRELEEVINV